jgi:hypothetical protein
MPASLGEQAWWTLEKAIQDGQCILFLGPGVAIDSAGDPLPIRLAQKFAAELRQAGKGDQVITPSDLAHVAQAYEREMPFKRDGLEFATTEFYRPYHDYTTPIHEHLAALPFSLCISTTPDRFLFNAFLKAPAKQPILDYYHFNPERSPVTPSQPASPEKYSEQRPLIYGLYGNVEKSSSLVLTESDLIDFLVNVARNLPPLRPDVTSRLTEPRTSFLFMGFGFRHWYVRILLHVLRALRARSPGRPSLALEDPEFFQYPDQPQTALFFNKGHLIGFYDVPWMDFAAELRKRFESQKSNRPCQVEVPANAPVAFLCHEHRDKPVVETLAAELQARGIKVWLDAQNLRGGDRWPDLIPNVLEKLCNYFVVCQSPRMLDKSESYCFFEIDLARTRQPKFAPGLRYVIPVILEHGRGLPLEPLQTYHCIDLTGHDGIGSLAQTILEDWERRRAMKPV